MEAYIEEIIVKSKLEVDHIADLQETFNSLWAAIMWLNPEKCVFGSKAGRLLGYLISKWGIEANPSKIRAITEMAPPPA